MRALAIALLFPALVAAGPSPAIRGGRATGAEHDKDVARALAALNEARRVAGLQGVSLDEKMSAACKLHAEYLRKNHGRPEVAGLRAHEEDPTLPGYTKEGAEAGRRADIAWTAPPEAAASWVNSLYHRTPILQPSLKNVGLASVQGPAGPISVLMFDTLGGGGGSGPPIAYPADGQTGVPLTFTGEIPDPVPAGAAPSGSPVTLAFGHDDVTVVSAKLTDASGADVPVHLSSPEKPATSFPQGGVVCLIPKRPFRPSTTYRVRLETGGKGAGTFSWTFTTAKPLPIDASDAKAVEAALGTLSAVSGNVENALRSGGNRFLRIGESDGLSVSVVIADEAWPAFTAAGIEDLSHYSGRRVEALGVPRRTGTFLNVPVSSPEDLVIVAVEPPRVEADGPGPGASVGKLVRLHGRVRSAGTFPGSVFLHLGDSGGRMVSVFVPEAVWKKTGRDLGAAKGTAVTATGVVRLHDGKYLNLSVDRAGQLEWER